MLYGYIQFHVHLKTDDIYKNIAEDVEITFDTSNYRLNRPPPKGKNKKKMKEFVGLREKTDSCLIDDTIAEKEQRVQKSVSQKNLSLKIIKTRSIST